MPNISMDTHFEEYTAVTIQLAMCHWLCDKDKVFYSSALISFGQRQMVEVHKDVLGCKMIFILLKPSPKNCLNIYTLIILFEIDYACNKNNTSTAIVSSSCQ